MKEAEVVCRQLGFTGALGAENNARYGQGAGLIVFAGIECSGLEGSIIDCDHGQWYIADSCSHSGDAGVSCIPPGESNGMFDITARTIPFYTNSVHYYSVTFPLFSRYYLDPERSRISSVTK